MCQLFIEIFREAEITKHSLPKGVKFKHLPKYLAQRLKWCYCSGSCRVVDSRARERKEGEDRNGSTRVRGTHKRRGGDLFLDLRDNKMLSAVTDSARVSAYAYTQACLSLHLRNCDPVIYYNSWFRAYILLTTRRLGWICWFARGEEDLSQLCKLTPITCVKSVTVTHI